MRNFFLGGGTFWGKVKKRCGKTFGGGKNFNNKNLRGNFRGEVMLGGVWWGRNAGKFKKKRILQKEIGGGEFLGKSKKKVWEHFGGGVKKNLWGAIFGKIPQKKFEGGILGGEVMLGGRVVGEECWEF